MSMFFTGCTHFDHANIIRLANRPFASVEEMNETIISRWNERVQPDDVVFHLGDFGLVKDPSRLDALLQRLNGNLILVHGNHDLEMVKQHPRWVESLQYLDTVAFADRKVVLFHYPIEEWNGFYRGALHLHAHTHQRDPKGATPIKNRVNVTVEAWNYAPVSVEAIKNVWPAEQAA